MQTCISHACCKLSADHANHGTTHTRMQQQEYVTVIATEVFDLSPLSRKFYVWRKKCFKIYDCCGYWWGTVGSLFRFWMSEEQLLVRERWQLLTNRNLELLAVCICRMKLKLNSTHRTINDSITLYKLDIGTQRMFT